jgi:hypothetical protein
VRIAVGMGSSAKVIIFMKTGSSIRELTALVLRSNKQSQHGNRIRILLRKLDENVSVNITIYIFMYVDRSVRHVTSLVAPNVYSLCSTMGCFVKTY